MTRISALTIASGRAAHLANLIRGLQAQTRPPDELIIAVMQESDYIDLPETSFPIRQLQVTGTDLPLAAARNMAADAASGDLLIFIDVDCIPDPDFVRDYLHRMHDQHGLFMGEVLYLPGGATQNGLDFDHFAALAVRHSDRAAPPQAGLASCTDYRCFWSLNFAMHRHCWQRSPRFDTRYSGYGGEDTDFGKALQEAGTPIWWINGGRAYHQYHPHFMPPVHHLHSVVKNAETFAQKWGHRTMEHWLYAFHLMGLIRNGPDGIEILRQPAEADFSLCSQQSHMPYANTRRVLDLLQGISNAESGRLRDQDVRQAQSSMLYPSAR